MAAAPPLTLTAPDGGVAAATIDCLTADIGVAHTLVLTVSRAWVDILIGTTDGGGELTLAQYGVAKARLMPGDHVLTFTPTVARFWITATRNREGLAAVTGMYFTGAGDLTLPTPYDEEDLYQVRSAQSRDVRWFWHTRHEWRALIRYANSSWGFVRWQVSDGPFLSGNDEKITLTPADTRGTDIALVASEGVFAAAHVGGLFRLTHAGQLQEKTINSADDWSDPILVTGVEESRIFQAVVSATGSTVTLQRSVGSDVDWQAVQSLAAAQTHQIDDGFDNSAIYYRVGVASGDYVNAVDVALIYGSGETTGVARIVTVTNATTAEVDILSPFGAATATRHWAEGAWSSYRGWPVAGDLFDGRLWLGAVLNVFASAPDDFASFAISAADDGAINRQIAIGDASPIRWIKGAFRLQIGTDSGAADIDAVRINEAQSLQIRSSSFDEPITPTNMTMREVSAKIVFVDASRSRLHRLTYDLDTNSFTADDLNRLHEDIGFLGGGFIDLGFQARPKARLWAPRADGQLPSLTLSEQEQVVGWARMVLGENTLYAAQLADEDPDNVDTDLEKPAKVESACGTPGVDGTIDGDQDFVHIIVQRMLNGELIRSHERIEREKEVDPADLCFLEAAVLYEGEPARYISGLDHLFGETVYGWGDGSQWGPYEVVELATLDDSFVEGEIGVDLGEDSDVRRIWLGLEMRTRYVSGKLPYGAQAGTAVGEKKRVDHVTFLFKDTAMGGVFVGIVDGNKDDPFAFDPDLGETDPMIRITDLASGFTTDAAVALFSGELEVQLESSTMMDPRVAIEFRGAGPAAVLGYVVNMTTQESI